MERWPSGKTVADRFNYDYSEDEVKEVADRSKKLAKHAADTHVVFNNNALDYAPRAASRLRAALAEVGGNRLRLFEVALCGLRMLDRIEQRHDLLVAHGSSFQNQTDGRRQHCIRVAGRGRRETAAEWHRRWPNVVRVTAG